MMRAWTTRWRRVLRACGGLAPGVAIIVAAACGGEDRSSRDPRGSAGGGTSFYGGGPVGAEEGPCAPGSTAACHVEVGRNGSVTTCVHGERTCEAGIWGPCVGGFTSRVASGEGAGSEALPSPDSQRLLSYSDPGPCANNPCDPSCQAFDEAPEGGIVVPPVIEGYFYHGSLADALALTPSGFIDKGAKTPCSTVSDCQFDFRCAAHGVDGVVCGGGAASCCVPWDVGETLSTCLLPELTSGFACTMGGVPLVPVCNRGSVVAPAGVAIYIFPGNSTQYPSCTPDKNPGVCHTQAPIPPGECINVTGCPGLTGNGTKTVMVNPPPLSPSGTTNLAYVPECECGNNWGVWSGNNAPCYETPIYGTLPKVVTETYAGVCPPGTRVQWQYLAYDATTPGDSSVVFEARAAATEADLASATLVTLATAKAEPAPDTQKCSMSGPEPCPVNLHTALDAEAAGFEPLLELVITLNPTSDKSEGPTLSHWEVTYSCPWAE